MPCLMLHLMTARQFNPQASPLFLVGSIAPDCVGERSQKDRTHLRDRADRPAALRQLALAADCRNDFQLGLLLHLFLDYQWDIGPQYQYMSAYCGENWFIDYRHEIALASAWAFHHIDWSAKAWQDMAAVPADQYDGHADFPPPAIARLIQRNGAWHQENDIGPSPVFGHDFIECFAEQAANDFRIWLANLL